MFHLDAALLAGIYIRPLSCSVGDRQFFEP